MRFAASLPILSTCAVLFACTNGGSAGAHSAVSGAAPPAATGATPATPAGNGDPDHPANGAGVPPGYVGRTDDSTKSIADAKYSSGMGEAWEVQTGPAHILYNAKDTASGTYTLRTEIDQLEAPHHPEAYGVFFGGQNLTGPNQQYTYFIVRGNGMYAVKARDGAAARTVIDFTANPNVPTADASGKAAYTINVSVAPDSVRFLVNGKQVAAVAKSAVSAAGIAGIRINHNLHVTVKPLVISR